MSILLDGSFQFDLSNFDYDLNFEQLLSVIENKYAYIVHPCNRRIKTLLRIQCVLEIVGELLDQIEMLIKETFKIVFTLAIIKKEIDLITRQLLVIFKEIKDFFDVMKESENKNAKTFTIMKELSVAIMNFEKSYFLIPEYEKEIIEETINSEIPLLKTLLETELVDFNSELVKNQSKDALFGTSLSQILSMNHTFQLFNRLRELHCEFSFILLHIFLKENCPQDKTTKKEKVVPIPSNYLDELLARFMELAQIAVEKVNVCRHNYCVAFINRKRLTENYLRKQELQIQQLNNLQIIIRIINDLDEKNDNLVGKLIKTNQLYENVNAILERPWAAVKIAASTFVSDKVFTRATRKDSQARPDLADLLKTKSSE